MKILIDMNLSPSWVTVFRQHGVHAEHWSSVGDPCAAIQVRTQDVMPDHWGDKMVRVLQANAEALDSGALITVDEDKNRVRILPF